MRRIAPAVLIALVVTACGGEGDPSSTTVAATTSSSVAPTTSDVTTTAPPSTTTTTTTTEAPDVAVGAQLLVAGDDGVYLIDSDGTVSLLVDSPAAFAVDDLAGGVLFQVERFSRQGRSVVYRVRGDGTDAVRTLVPTVEQGLTLNGVAVDGDEPFVYYSRNEGQTPDDSTVTLRRYSLDTREVTELRTIGGWESGAFPVSISQGLILYNWSAEAYGGMYFTDLTANDAAVAANPAPEEGFFDCGICPFNGELSHDGQRLAYLESTDGIQYVIIRHVASGAEVRRIELPDAAWSPLTLDLSANHLVVNRRSNDGVVSAWLYDLNQVNPEPLALAVDGEAYLTLAPVTVQGPIPGP